MERNAIIENLAAHQHDIWSEWMGWLFSYHCSAPQSDGSAIIKPEKVERWMRQMQTPYSELSEEEKESDRKIVETHLSTIAKRLESAAESPEPPTAPELQRHILKLEEAVTQLQKQVASLLRRLGTMEEMHP